jgi:hypothetical protein
MTKIYHSPVTRAVFIVPKTMYTTNNKTSVLGTMLLAMYLSDIESCKDNHASLAFYPAKTAFTDQYSLPNIFFDIGQL